MKLEVSYTPRFMKTFMSLNKKEMNLVQEGILAWLKKPENPSSNFEKLQFQGNNIYSIRANDAWRIIMAKIDGVYFLLHTGGQHDKTNDWARNKQIDINTISGSFAISDINVQEVKEKIEEDKQAEDKRGVFEQMDDGTLALLSVPENWYEAVREVKTMDHLYLLMERIPDEAIDNLEIILEEKMPLNIFLSQLRSDAAQLPKEINELIKVKPGFNIISEDEDLYEQMQKDINVFRFYLHPSQRYLAYHDFKGPMKVTGSAGTGKTVVAMNRAKQLVEKLGPQDKPVLFTTYTTYLIKNLQSIFEAEGIGKSKLHVVNLHEIAKNYAFEIELFSPKTRFVAGEREVKGLWSSFVRKHPELGFDAEFLQAEYEQVFQKQHITSFDTYKHVKREGRGQALGQEQRKKVWDAIRKYEMYQHYTQQIPFSDLIYQLNKYLEKWPEYRPYQHIICDEVQDFNNSELRLLRNLVEEKANDLFLVGDPFQNIYNKKLNFSLSGINIRGKRSNKLRINYRTTEEIREFAVELVNKNEYLDFNGNIANMEGDRSLIIGDRPVYINFDQREEELEFMVKFVQDSFSLIKLHELCITARTNKEVDEIISFLRSKNLPVKSLKEVRDLSEIHDRVVVGTMHSLKGLEFKNLIVSGFSGGNFPFIPVSIKKADEQTKQEFIRTEFALYYVVCSRAISQLVLCGTGAPIEEWDSFSKKSSELVS